jgi:predicted nucleotidyltransferase component of viral defense system
VLTKPQLARYVHSSGLNDPGFAENDVVLTYLLQLLVERGFIERVVFKGGTCIRKMLLGNRGRFSTDLDFTARTEVSDLVRVPDLRTRARKRLHQVRGQPSRDTDTRARPPATAPAGLLHSP